MTARKLHINFCSPQVHRPRFFCAPATAPENSSLPSCVWLFIVILRFNLQLVFTNAPNILGRSKQANTPLRKQKLWQGVIQIPPREGNIRSCLGGIVWNAYSSKNSSKKTFCPCGKFIDDLKLLYVIRRKYLGLLFQTEGTYQTECTSGRKSDWGQVRAALTNSGTNLVNLVWF